MKIVSLATKMTYEITVKNSNENYSPCPECSHIRKATNKSKKCFSWNDTKKTGHCNNCNASFVEFKPFITLKEYKRPEYNGNKTELSSKALAYFESRKITQETIKRMKIYSDTEYFPQLEMNSESIQFPYFYNGNLINIKSRGANKSFKLSKEAELIFYNLDCVSKNDEIIIVEGELDCLSYLECGFNNCVSVPNGAGGKNLEYLDNYIELFDGKTIYIATDNDAKGYELREELIRRFGSERCKIALFGECKDANEVLTRFGILELKNTIKNAFELPVEGIINLTNQYDEIYDLYINGLQRGNTIGINDIDDLISWETKRLAVWTGIPSHGKSEFVDFFTIMLNLRYGWKAAYFSPENYPVKYHYSKIASKITGKNFNRYKLGTNEFEDAFEYINDNFFFIYPEDDMSFKNILEKAKYAVKKHGIKQLIIDPYNKIEHLKERGENETEYISRFLDALTNFAKKHDVLIHLVAHPRKMGKDAAGNFERVNLYDINGSANFYNKCDYGLSVYRDKVKNEVELHILKVKFKHLGESGVIKKIYNYNNGRFENIDSTVNDWSDVNYLIKVSNEQPDINNMIEPNKSFSLEPTNEKPF